jgi:hypothetical protein
MNRRGFLAGIGAALAAPAIVKAGVLMPVKPTLIMPMTAAEILALREAMLDRIINPPIFVSQMMAQAMEQMVLSGNLVMSFEVIDQPVRQS